MVDVVNKGKGQPSIKLVEIEDGALSFSVNQPSYKSASELRDALQSVWQLKQGKTPIESV